MFDSGTVRQPDELNNKRTGYDSRRQFFALNETHRFSPRLVNSFRFGINRVVATTGLTFASGNPLPRTLRSEPCRAATRPVSSFRA